ncbi:MAG: hypothetical protein NTY35_12905 [Planctomycetota bacterium]|nr:hypothetical protein [Planctomycetota bacterium]
MLPVLLHELNNHTQYLSALGALESAGDPLPSRGDGLARTAREVEELGWLLGLCAGGYGTDLLRDRTEKDGLGPLARLVRKALRREGHDLERADRELPELPAHLGWRGAWRVGELLFACASSLPGPLAWELEADGDALLLTCRVDPASIEAAVGGPALESAECGTDWVRFRIATGVAT